VVKQTKNFVTHVDTELWFFETLAEAQSHAETELQVVNREAHDGIDEELATGIVVMQVLSRGTCTNPTADYRLHEYHLKPVPDYRTQAIEEMQTALMTVAGWVLPPTGQTWGPKDPTPVSYEAVHGTNGAKNFIRRVAQDALHNAKTLSTGEGCLRAIGISRDKAVRECLERLVYEIEKIEDTEANKSVDPAQEDSYWIAGNIPRTLYDQVKSVLASIDAPLTQPEIDLHLRQHALIMLKAGWTVSLSPDSTNVRWTSPMGVCGYESDSIDRPPADAIQEHQMFHRAHAGELPA